jgi:hypothetical protein
VRVGRARAAVEAVSPSALEISGRISGEPTRVSVGTMHYAKGLENSGASLIDSTPNCLRNSDSESHEPCSEPRAKALSLSNSGHPTAGAGSGSPVGLSGASVVIGSRLFPV